jgi:WD40 repeat protein
MSVQERKKARAPAFPEGKPYEFYHYRDIDEAEARSRDIGFPLFCCHWDADGTAYIGGGGGTRGMGVRSAVVACRLVDGDAIDANLPFEALVSPDEVAAGTAEIPAQPFLQAVGEVTTDDDMVLSVASTPHNYLFPAPLTSGLTAAATARPGSLQSTPHGPPRAPAGAASPASASSSSGVGTGVNRPLFGSPTGLLSPPSAAVSSSSSSSSRSESDNGAADPAAAPLLAVSASVCTVIFESRGSGAVASSSLPPFKPQADPAAPAGPLSSPAPLPRLTSPLSRLSSPSGATAAGVGRKRPLKRFAFRTDFADRQGIQSCAVFSPDGRLLAAGGQDGVVRVFLLDDPDLLYTAVVPGPAVGGGAAAQLRTLAGQRGVVPGSVPQTPARPGAGVGPGRAPPTASRSNFSALVAFTPRVNPIVVSPYSTAAAPPLPFVSPLFLAAAKLAGPVKTLGWSPCGRALIATMEADDEAAVSFWRAPSAADVRARGVRIPVDYLDATGRVDHFAGAGAASSNSAAESKQQPSGERRAPAASVAAAYTGCDDLRPLAILTVEPELEIRGAVYWAPPQLAALTDPRTGKPLPAAAATTGALAGADVLLATVSHRRTQKHRQTGPGYLCRYFVPQSLYEQEPLPAELARAPPTGPKVPAPDAKFVAARARGVRLSAEVLIEKEDAPVQMVVSPNGQFVAVATTKSLHVFTGPAPTATRAAVLSAQGLDDDFCRSVAHLPPLSLASVKPRCFGLPCTGLSFDPSSRAVLSVSASRGIAILPIRPEPRRGCCGGGGGSGAGGDNRGCCGCLVDTLLCCPVWRCCVRSQIVLFAANLFLVVFLALLVQHFSVTLYDDAPYAI